MSDSQEPRPPRIVAIGEVLWDVFPEGEAFGGAPANFACHCRSLGAEVALVSCVGNDDRGQRALAFLASHGVNSQGVAVRSLAETGAVLVSLDEAGKPSYEIREGAAWDRIPWSEEAAHLAAADAVSFGTLAQRSAESRETIQRFLRTTRPDCLRVFDINLRQHYHTPEVVLASLEAASVLKINDEELPVLASILGLEGTEQDQLNALVERFQLRLAVLTCGAKGAWMLAPDAASFAQPPAVTVASTVGAGDSFTAAVVVGLLRGLPLDEVNRRANAVAAYVCSQREAVPPLPASLRYDSGIEGEG